MSNKLSKNVFAGFVLLVLVLSFVGNVSAITASIGNARMILRPDGDSIDRFVLVRNVNDVPVNIEITTEGDAAEDFDLKETSFTLQPGEEKRAHFTIHIRKSETTETKVNVAFSPVDGGTGAGLSSTVIVIPQGPVDEEEDGGFSLFGGNDDEGDEVVEEDIGSEENRGSGFGLMTVGATFTIVLFLALLILLTMAKKHIKKKRENKSSKKSKDK